MEKKRVVVGMSGGIDSSVAALLLKNAGYEVIGVTLKHLPDSVSENGTKTCCSLDDINDAKRVCYNLEIPHYVLNVVDEFEKEVMDYFIKGYERGITPSPCVICDEKVKIKKIVDFADKMGIEYISTGHYSKMSENNLLKWDRENKKDQSYMLYRLDKSVVERFVFPLSEYTKEEVREIARQNGIHTHSKPDSQGICFAPRGYKEFLKKVYGEGVKKGKFVDKEGKIIGEHEGYQFYTVGQRRGLGLNLGKPYFVIKIVPERNEVILGDFEELLIDKIEIVNYKFHYDIKECVGKKVVARPRFSSKGLCGKLFLERRELENTERLIFLYEKKNHENSEGQHVVFYYEDEIIGGGEIKFLSF